jgi:hypothetical protein
LLKINDLRTPAQSGAVKNGAPSIARRVGGPDHGRGLMHQGRTLICLLPSNQIKPNQGENIIDD